MSVGEGCRHQRAESVYQFLDPSPSSSRFDAPTPKASNSEDELPEDYPVVKNMLHRLTGKEVRREATK